MQVQKIINNEEITLKVCGRLDTMTSVDLEPVVMESAAACRDLIMDLEQLEYISSAGLRVLMKAQKAMMGKGSLTVTHVSEEVMEILELTGFVNILTIV